jgi:hypothetical protein
MKPGGGGGGRFGGMQILNLPAPVVPPAREDDSSVGD